MKAPMRICADSRGSMRTNVYEECGSSVVATVEQQDDRCLQERKMNDSMAQEYDYLNAQLSMIWK